MLCSEAADGGKVKKFFSKNIYKKYREVVLMITDMSLALFSLAVAIFLKVDLDWREYLDLGKAYMVQYIAVFFITYFLSFLLFRVHKGLWSYIGIKEMMTIAVSVIASCFIQIIYTVFIAKSYTLVSITIISGLLCFSAMINIRALYRSWKSMNEKNIFLDNALIIGAGDGGYLMLKEVEKNKRFNANVIGFVDDVRKNMRVSGKKVLGTTYQLPKLVEKYAVKKVYIAIPSASRDDLNRIISICQSCGVEIKIMKQSDSMVIDPDVQTFPIHSVSINDLLGRGEVKLNIEEISSYLTSKTVLVTGAGGSIGSVLCRQIIRFKPEKIVLVDIYENSMYELEQELLRGRMQGLISKDIEVCTAVASVRDSQSAERLFEEHRPQVVFHAAAHKHVPLMEGSPLEAIKNNVFGTKNIIEVSMKYGAERFILISTDKAVNPVNVMGATKRMAELVMQSYAGKTDMKMAAVRFGNVLGSNGSVIPLFEKQIADGGPITITHRDVERYFMTIPEAAQLVMQAGSYADKGEIFVLNMGEPVKILSLAEKMIILSGLTPYEDIDIVEIGLRPGEKMYEELHMNEEIIISTQNRSINISKPVSLKDFDLQSKLDEMKQLISENADNAYVKEALLRIVSTA